MQKKKKTYQVFLSLIVKVIRKPVLIIRLHENSYCVNSPMNFFKDKDIQ